MKINELARRLHLSPRAIRLYEAKGLLKPARNADNGYRTYTEQDAWRLQTIAALREIGISLDQIRRLLDPLDRNNAEEVRRYLELQRAAMYARWVNDKHVLQAMDEWIGRLDRDGSLCLEELCELTERLKTIRHARDDWHDRWGYDRIAAEGSLSPSTIAAGPLTTVQQYEQALQCLTEWVLPEPGETGLDIGAGTGALAGLLLQRGAMMHAVDQSQEMLARCRMQYPEMPVKLGNMLVIPYMDSRFDFVVSSFAFHHLNDEQQLLALEEMSRVLKPQGRIAIAGFMFENEDVRRECLSDDRQAALLHGKYPADRSRLIRWFREHGFSTVQQSLTPWIHLVFAVRKH